MLRHDARRLHVLIARHYVHTGSAPAHRVLEHWRDLLPKFVKVMPLDYRRALQELQARAVAPVGRTGQRGGLKVQG
jgi:glutamate synthase (NADPH) large chain